MASASVLPYLPESDDYRRDRASWWRENCTLWARYVASDVNRPRLYSAVIGAVATHACGGLHRATVLDLGCGEGSFLRCFAQMYPEANLSGIDSCPEMVALARSLEGAAEFSEGDFEAPGTVVAAPCDVVTAILSFTESGRIDRAFETVSRALAAQGIAAVVVLDSTVEVARHAVSLVGDAELTQRLVSGGVVLGNHFEVDGVASSGKFCRVLRSDSACEQAASAAGLRVVALEHVTGEITSSNPKIAPVYRIMLLEHRRLPGGDRS